MFEKVLIAEDFDSNNKSLVQLLQKDLKIPEVVSAFYCDEAFLKCQHALEIKQTPFELLITDLNFNEDPRSIKIKDGLALIDAIKNIQPNIKIIILSAINRLSKIKQIVNNHPINGYVIKSSNDLKELQLALYSVANNEDYFSRDIELGLKSNELLVLSQYDTVLLEYLSKGFSQKELPKIFEQKNIRPASLSSIEKRINRLNEAFEAKNITHLISILKDNELI